MLGALPAVLPCPASTEVELVTIEQRPSEKVVIGDATLYLGDCMEIMPCWGKVDVIVTDPPYLDGDLSEVLYWLLDQTHRLVVTPGKQEVFNWLARNRKPVWQYAWKCSGGHTTGGAACLHVLFEPILAYCYPRKPLPSDLLHFPIRVDKAAQGHPWPKPLPLMEHLVHHWSDTGEVVADPYMGSGTTGVAALSMGRKFVGVEKNPEYFALACRRIEDSLRQKRLIA